MITYIITIMSDKRAERNRMRNIRRRASIAHDILWNRYVLGEELLQHDQEFMMSLLKKHPSAAKKIGTGVQSIYVDRNKCWPDNRCFHIVRVDGTRTEFSYLKCLGLIQSSRKGCDA